MAKKYLITTDDVDSTMSATSTNPVQNKVIKSVVDAKLDIQQGVAEAGKVATVGSDGKLVMKAVAGQSQVDWSQTTTTEIDYIKNKPFQTLGTGLTKDADNKLNVNIVSAFQTTPDDTHVASEKLVSTQLATKQDKIAAGTSGNVVTYSGTAGTVGALAVDTTPTADSTNLVQSGGVYTALSSKQTTANLVTTFQTTPDDTHYPSEKLVKDTADGKIAYYSTSTNKVFTLGKDTTGWFIDDGE